MEKSFFEKYKTSEVTSTRRVINTPSAFIRENFFYIQEAGHLKSLKPHLSRRQGLSSYLFMIVLSGCGTVGYRDSSTHGGGNGAYRSPGASLPKSPQTDSSSSPAMAQSALPPLVTVSALAGDCFFLDCSSEYTHISSEEDPWELLWIHFYGPQARAYYTYFREGHSWHFVSAHRAELTTSIQTVIRFHEEKTDDADLLAAQQIVNILTTLCAKTGDADSEDSALREKLKNVLLYLDEHYTQDISLDFLSEKFFISKYYLSREFKKEFGTTIIQYVLAKKITNAKELLRYCNASIEDIAGLCGIDDASYFNKVFKKMEGCTASEYRRRW